MFLDMKYRLEDWYEFFTTAGFKGILAVDPNDEKIKRLLNMLGFKYKGCADNMYVYFYGEV